MHAGYQGPGQMEVSCAGSIAMGRTCLLHVLTLPYLPMLT